MCGLAGFVDRRPQRAGEAAALAGQAQRMAGALRHRGPDDAGVWVDALSGVALGHRRLSIIDLSPTGAQPMQSGNGRYVIAYNGEVYNFPVLRQELERAGHHFRGHSDTEVVVEAIAAWGVAAAVRRLAGMFALAIWDQKLRSLSLVRDRMGVKPLYWCQQNGLLLFASELKALHRFDGWRPQINPAAMGDMICHSYIADPCTIYHGVYKLIPGSILTLPTDGPLRIERYWDLAQAVRAGAAAPKPDAHEALPMLENLLKDAVKSRMVADAPLGAFLSGGIDSSLIVALMQAQSPQKIRTFTIGFSEDRVDEAPYARQVANILGTDHTEHVFTAQDALQIVPGLPEIYDEPFGDSSQLPTCLLSALTGRHVKVALSGDGGDEVFAGYQRYAVFSRGWNMLAPLPPGLRRSLSRALLRIPVSRWDAMLRRIPGLRGIRQGGGKLHQLASAMGAQEGISLYHAMMQQGNAPRRFLRHEPQPRIAHGFPVSEKSLMPQMPFSDMQTYLPGDILTKVDRASMAVGLEVREPLLDHRVVEFAWTLPLSMKFRRGQGKWPLRQLLGQYLPQDLIDRPKRGFTVPLQEWLRGPLREWGAELLDPQKLEAEGYFNGAAVWAGWQSLQQDGGESPHLLWNILMFQAWKQHWHG